VLLPFSFDFPHRKRKENACRDLDNHNFSFFLFSFFWTESCPWSNGKGREQDLEDKPVRGEQRAARKRREEKRQQLNQQQQSTETAVSQPKGRGVELKNEAMQARR
jgi:hypothetical protein